MMRLALLLPCIAVTGVLAACRPEPPAEGRSAEAGPLTVNVLDCGTIAISDLDTFSSAGDFAGQADEFTNTCYLINHPKGRLLWDLGLPSQLAGSAPFTQQIFTVSLNQTISDQLAGLGVTPAEVTYVSVSHSHFDHVGQVDQVKGATWLVNQAEYDAMFPPDGAALADPTLAPVYAIFQRMQRQVIGDEHDVFGDGSVVIFATPGHTLGHASLQLKMPEAGTVLLTGDLYHRSESRPLNRVPRFNFNQAQTLTSMAAFEKRAADQAAKVIIQHEPQDVTPLGGVIR